MTEYRQEAPFCIQVELTHGCPLRCPFCAVSYYKDRNYRFMSLETAELFSTMLAESGWNPRIEFAMHGEPTMNPDWDKIVAVIRKYNPKLSMLMLTNGYQCQNGKLEEIVTRFHEAGGNTIAIDMYHGKVSEDIMSQDYALTCQLYPEEDIPNPHKRYLKKRAVLIRDIRDNAKDKKCKTHCKFENHGGVIWTDTDNQDKPCTKPFREMGICYDGGVNICCCDFVNELCVGNIHEALSLDDIWNCDLMQACRRMLLSGKRIMRPCKGCNAVGHRIGLLPDKKGQQKDLIGKFTPEDEALILNRTPSQPHEMLDVVNKRIKGTTI